MHGSIQSKLGTWTKIKDHFEQEISRTPLDSNFSNCASTSFLIFRKHGSVLTIIDFMKLTTEIDTFLT